MSPVRSALLVLGLVFSTPVLASRPHCRLERIDLVPPESPEELRALASVVELEGSVDAGRPARDFVLKINGKPAARADKAVPFEHSGIEAYLVLAVETSALYGKQIDPIKEALHEFIDALPPRQVKLKLLLFGNEVPPPPPRFQMPGAVADLVDDIEPDDEGDVQLVPALRLGMLTLTRLQPKAPAQGKSGPPPAPPRKLIVALSDGINTAMDRGLFRELGKELRKQDIAFFPVAFSPADDRGPLLNLGELSKRSAGTFRWAQKPDSLKDQFTALAEELKQLQVLTFRPKKMPDPEQLAKVSFTLGCGELESNPFGVEPPHANEAWWWKYLKYALFVLGALGAFFGALKGASFYLDHKARKLGAVPPAPRMPTPAAGPAQPAVGPVVYAQPPGPPLPASAVVTLVMIGGKLGGQRVQVGPGLLIGSIVSGPGTLTITDDPSVGPSHCQLQRDPYGYVLYDLNSRTGCFVNDRRISGAQRLQDGDIVRLGTGTQFKFRID